MIALISIASLVFALSVTRSAASVAASLTVNDNISVALALPKAATRLAAVPAVIVAVMLPEVSPITVFALAADEVPDNVEV